MNVKTDEKEMLGHRAVTWLVEIRGGGELFIVFE
jgi:hypothetical protein